MLDILIADDHPLFRDALQRAVRAAVTDACVHGADTVDALLSLIDDHPQSDLLLLDLHMPGANGYSALVHIRSHYPTLPIIVISVHEEARVVRRAMAHGASGYVPKSAPANEIEEAIRAVLNGDVWLPHSLADMNPGLDPDETEAAGHIATLTPQQFRVMTMISAGLLNKQIAYQIGISEATVKAHMTAIMRKLGVNNRTQVALAGRMLAVERDNLEPDTAERD